MRLVLALLCTLGALASSSCQQVFAVNAKFDLDGKVTDTLGNGIQLTAEDKVFLCVDFDFELADSNGQQLELGRSKDNCLQIVSGADGSYRTTKYVQTGNKKADRVTISGPEVYGKVTIGEKSYLLAASIASVSVDSKGGKITANIPILRKLR